MKNRYNFTINILLCLSLQINAQTFVGGTLAYDISKIHAEPIWRIEDNYVEALFDVEDGYAAQSLSYGLRIEQRISNRWSLSIHGNYTKKKVNALINTFNIGQFRGIDFDYYRSSLTVNYTAFNHLIIGLGPTYHWIEKINLVSLYGNFKFPYMDDKQEYGGTVRLGFKYRNGLLECYYNNGYKIKGAETLKQKNGGAKLDSIDSVGISVSYMFQVFSWKKGKKGKGVYCPRF